MIGWGYESPRLRRRRKRKALDAQRPQRLQFHQAVRVRVGAREAEGRLERDGRVRDHARDAQVVLARRVQHERVQEDDVAGLAGELDGADLARSTKEISSVDGSLRSSSFEGDCIPAPGDIEGSGGKKTETLKDWDVGKGCRSIGGCGESGLVGWGRGFWIEDKHEGKGSVHT